MIKGIIFDLDGTLMDSAKAVEVAANRVRERKNLGDVHPAFVKKVLSDPTQNGGETALLVEENADGKERRDALMLFGRYLDIVFNDYAFPYPQVIETLQLCRDKGIKLGVISNRITLFLHQWLEYAGLIAYFDVVAGIDAVVTPPPAPDIIEHALRFMDCAAQEVIFVGDSYLEMASAKSANVKTVFAKYGYESNVAATWQIDSFSSLLEIVGSENRGRDLGVGD